MMKYYLDWCLNLAIYAYHHWNKIKTGQGFRNSVSMLPLTKGRCKNAQFYAKDYLASIQFWPLITRMYRTNAIIIGRVIYVALNTYRNNIPCLRFFVVSNILVFIIFPTDGLSFCLIGSYVLSNIICLDNWMNWGLLVFWRT